VSGSVRYHTDSSICLRYGIKQGQYTHFLIENKYSSITVFIVEIGQFSVAIHGKNNLDFLQNRI
jgi:hypothetical protein